MSKRKKQNYDCEHCDNVIYTEHGEFVCVKIGKIVIEDYIPTDDYQGCKESEQG
ncbi:MAG: hypothetical protein PHY71_02270 [Bacteroidaceae bacterium]|nr:hypothetical protein [Bacteroidaceae bacterium]